MKNIFFILFISVFMSLPIFNNKLYGKLGKRPKPNKIIHLNNGDTISLTHYPGLRKIVFEYFSKSNDHSYKKLHITGKSNDNKRISLIKNIQYKHWKGFLNLPSNKDRVWHFDIILKSKSDKIISKNNNAAVLNEKVFSWENNSLGKSKIIVPPFTPLQIDSQKVKCLLKTYEFAGSGLIEQIKTDGENILANPFNFVYDIDNLQKIVWDKGRFIEKSPERTVYISNGNSRHLKLKLTATIEYDGMIWYKLAFLPKKKIKINNFSLVIPLKKRVCSLFHVVTAMSRYNKAGKLPDGQGLIWNSFESERKYINGVRLIKSNFIPYIWLGGPSRGISWFADSAQGFSLADNKPAIEIFRTSPNTNLKINFINTPVAFSKKRIIQFGIQATPVKKKNANYRQINCITYADSPDYYNLLMPVNPKFCGFYVDWAKYPIDKDYSFLRFMAAFKEKQKNSGLFYSNWKKKNFHKIYKYMQAHKEEIDKRLKRWFTPGDTLKSYYSRRLDSYFKLYTKMLKNTDGLLMYTNPTLSSDTCEEFKYYDAEWWGPLKNNYAYVGGKKNILTESYIDFYLWYAKKMLENGAVGIYLDDFYITPGMNPDSNSAFVNDDEKTIIPRMGILAQRELVKRLAVMMQEMKLKNPFIAVHFSGTSLVPVHSFANISLSWEVLYRGQDYTYRFSPSAILAESSGIHSGLIPFALKHIRTNSKNPEIRKMQMNEQTSSFFALSLLHGIRTNSRPGSNDSLAFYIEKLFKDFGIQNNKCKFIPYWDRNNIFSVKCDKNIKVSTYQKKNSLLFIIANLSANDKHVEISLQKATTAFWGNLETGKSCKTKIFSLSVPAKGFSLVYKGNKLDFTEIYSRQLSKHLKNLHCKLNFSEKQITLKPTKNWRKIINIPQISKSQMNINNEGSVCFNLDNTTNRKFINAVWRFKLDKNINLMDICGLEIQYSANGIPIRYDRGHAIISIGGKDQKNQNIKLPVLRCVDMINNNLNRNYQYFGDMNKFKKLEYIEVNILGLPYIKSCFKIKKINLIRLQKSLKDKTISSQYPESVIVKAGDITVRLSKRTHWTLRRIDYKGVNLGKDNSKSYYGSVIKFPDIGFIGSGHNENEKEKVTSLNMKINGKTIISPQKTYDAHDFYLHRKSKIKDVNLDTCIEISNNTITETVVIQTEQNIPVDLVYNFMQPFVTKFSDYAILDPNIEKHGKFGNCKKFIIKKPVRYTALYSQKLKKGIVNIIIDIPPREKWQNSYWDVPRVYRKHYFKTFIKSTIQKNKKYKYRMMTVPFCAENKNWQKKAKTILKSILDSKLYHKR